MDNENGRANGCVRVMGRMLEDAHKGDIVEAIWYMGSMRVRRAVQVVGESLDPILKELEKEGCQKRA